jgi:ribosomal-protein-alanine N-acetyltransferase
VKPLPAATKARPSHVRVRPAIAGDLDALVALEQDSFHSDRMSRAQYRHHLNSDSAVVLVAGGKTALSGSAVLFFRLRSRIARLYSLATARAARGQGVGAALLDGAIYAGSQRRCTAMRLEVRTDNAAAIALYVRYGFRQIGSYTAYYEDGADALRYERALP